MGRFGYARVSARGQKDDSQIDALTAAGCEGIWVDKASGKLARRPERGKCFERLRRGDELVITPGRRPRSSPKRSATTTTRPPAPPPKSPRPGAATPPVPAPGNRRAGHLLATVD
nr:recombinase family protein [Nocardia asiatica]